MGSVCVFTAGPKAGKSTDFAPMHSPVGSPCDDGSGSSGTIAAAEAAPKMGSVCSFTAGPKAGSTTDFSPMHSPIGSPCDDGAGSSGTIIAAKPAPKMGSVCSFTAGPKAGSSTDFAPMHSPIGSPCDDGAGSSGTIVAAMPAPKMGSVCSFTAGPKAGSSTDFAPMHSPIGSPCDDGAGSSGTIIAAKPAPVMGSICVFTAGPLAGSRRDFAPMRGPVGSPCDDGAGSSGVFAAGAISQPDTPAPVALPPQPDVRNFTAPSPTAQQVDAFLQQEWGYDPGRKWQVEAIEPTLAPKISKVVVNSTQQDEPGKVRTTVFFVTDDGKHAIANNDVINFGTDPFADSRRMLETGANGPYLGPRQSPLWVVLFADLDCPQCQATMPVIGRLAQDFPNAHIAYEFDPQTKQDHASYEASEYAICVAQQRGGRAFFQFVNDIYNNQTGLHTDTEQTMETAVRDAGADFEEARECADQAYGAQGPLDSSVALAQRMGITTGPVLYVNGRQVPANMDDYKTIQEIAQYDQRRESTEMQPSPYAHRVPRMYDER